MMISEELRDTDVVTDLQLWFRARDLAAAMDGCRRLVADLGAWGIEVGPVDGDQPGSYYARVAVRTRTSADESTLDAIQRVARSQLPVIGVPPELLEITESRGRPLACVPDARIEAPAGADLSVYVGRGRDPFGMEGADLDGVEPLGLTEEESREFLDALKAATTVQVLVVAELSEPDAIAARERVRRVARTLRQQVFPAEDDVEVGEPRRRPSGTVEVAASVGGTSMSSHDAVVAASRALRAFTWLEPEALESDRPDYFAVEAVPQERFVRLEVHAATGLGVVG
ncbi:MULTISPECIES: hypothetical protein [Amycolatopsis]|nr:MULTISPECIES: hypothetical protein [Amycolatopsis]MCF6425285.1 hypothetical protein [Amycolatopsis tucumanensis]